MFLGVSFYLSNFFLYINVAQNFKHARGDIKMINNLPNQYSSNEMKYAVPQSIICHVSLRVFPCDKNSSNTCLSWNSSSAKTDAKKESLWFLCRRSWNRDFQLLIPKWSGRERKVPNALNIMKFNNISSYYPYNMDTNYRRIWKDLWFWRDLLLKSVSNNTYWLDFC